jgi:hypothetical protein
MLTRRSALGYDFNLREWLPREDQERDLARSLLQGPCNGLSSALALSSVGLRDLPPASPQQRVQLRALLLPQCFQNAPSEKGARQGAL